ncbi:MAG: Mov34/MPN/PAD-1 family protein [bacterium]
MIAIRKGDLEKIYRHTKDAYPHECCGILVGKIGDEKEVAEVHRASNLCAERARDRYEISPEQLYEVDRRSQERGLAVIGFYHSHPNHSSQPSPFDAERAWPSYSYLIVSVNDEGGVGARSWVWNEEKREFEEELLMTPASVKRSLDLAGEVCPINWVKTKLALEELEAGDILKVKLDNGEPIRNVPRSAKEEGHRIIRVEQETDGFVLWIRKGDKLR